MWNVHSLASGEEGLFSPPLLHTFILRAVRHSSLAPIEMMRDLAVASLALNIELNLAKYSVLHDNDV